MPAAARLSTCALSAMSCFALVACGNPAPTVEQIPTQPAVEQAPGEPTVNQAARGAATPAQLEASAAEAGIRATMQAYADAINERDFEAFVSHFAPDGDAIAFGSPKATGPEAIRELMATAWAQFPTSRRIDITVNSIRFLSSDVAIVDATGEFTTDPMHDRATLVFVRSGAAWQTAVFRVYEPIAEM